jgi:hypothetical protein
VEKKKLTMHDREQMWHTADGRGIMIKDMELGHLVNVINWIIDNPISYPLHVLDLMIAEANYRKIFLFSEGKSYPQSVGERWKIIDPVTGEGRIEPPPKEYIESIKENIGYQEMSKRTQEKRKVRNDS